MSVCNFGLKNFNIITVNRKEGFLMNKAFYGEIKKILSDWKVYC